MTQLIVKLLIPLFEVVELGERWATVDILIEAWVDKWLELGEERV